MRDYLNFGKQLHHNYANLRDSAQESQWSGQGIRDKIKTYQAGLLTGFEMFHLHLVLRYCPLSSLSL